MNPQLQKKNPDIAELKPSHPATPPQPHHPKFHRKTARLGSATTPKRLPPLSLTKHRLTLAIIRPTSAAGQARLTA